MQTMRLVKNGLCSFISFSSMLSGCGSSCAGGGGGAQFTLSTWNLYGFEEKNNAERVREACRVLASIGSDAILLQEATHTAELRGVICAELQSAYDIFDRHDANEGKSAKDKGDDKKRTKRDPCSGLAILVRKHGNLRPAAAKADCFAIELSTIKHMLALRVTHNSTGSNLLLSTSHLKAGSTWRHTRSLEFASVQHLVANSSDPMVFGGDMNIHESEAAMFGDLPEFVDIADAWIQTGKDPDAACTWYGGPSHKFRFDRVLYNEDLVTALSFEVFKTKPVAEGGCFLSDHR
jgi:endonuclease/exonuclease/phosphatase family metal-dependent hydrolase